MSGAHRMQNALRIMCGLDEVSGVLDRDRTVEFHRDPLRAAVRMDKGTWAKVFALIEARQTTASAAEDWLTRTGGYAFAHGSPEDGGDPGMTLRDWFAGQAISAMADRDWAPDEKETSTQKMARACYAVADAMIAASQKP